MKHFCDEWIQEWCEENGWTDLFAERQDHYWAFPPGAVMPEPIPSQTLRFIKAQKGLCPDERIWSLAAVLVAIVGIVSSYFFHCPMPLVFAFVFSAIAVARLEVEDI